MTVHALTFLKLHPQKKYYYIGEVLVVSSPMDLNYTAIHWLTTKFQSIFKLHKDIIHYKITHFTERSSVLTCTNKIFKYYQLLFCITIRIASEIGALTLTALRWDRFDLIWIFCIFVFSFRTCMLKLFSRNWSKMVTFIILSI